MVALLAHTHSDEKSNRKSSAISTAMVTEHVALICSKPTFLKEKGKKKSPHFFFVLSCQRGRKAGRVYLAAQMRMT